MFFCNKCGYLYNYSKGNKHTQIGGESRNNASSNIINKFKNQETIVEDDLANTSGQEILNSDRFDMLNKKEQRKIISLIKEIDKNFFDVNDDVDPDKSENNNSAYFICKSCNNTKLITAGTVVYSKKFNIDASTDVENYEYLVYDNTLARTKNYICKNLKCETHTDINLREAVITKTKNDRVVYVCTVCKIGTMT